LAKPTNYQEVSMSLTIWHNPRCSKSRQTLAVLEEKGLTPTVRLYLEDAPSEAEISETLSLLGLTARELMRRGEADYKEQGLADVSDEAALILAMNKTPKLIERPIVFNGGKAKIGRPPEGVVEIL
jgi:arsenate reductase